MTGVSNDSSSKLPTHLAILEHNIFIVWQPEYNLGLPIIDEQHRGIVSIINSLHYGMQNNYVDEMLSPIIDMMHDYTKIHFRVEEDLVSMIDYPNAKKHSELHLALMKQLGQRGHLSRFDNDSYQFMDFLKKWWIHHICREDLIFRDHLLALSATANDGKS